MLKVEKVSLTLTRAVHASYIMGNEWWFGVAEAADC